MSEFPHVGPGAASRFFENLLSSLAKASVPERQRRSYVKRIEELIKAHQGRKGADVITTANRAPFILFQSRNTTERTTTQESSISTRSGAHYSLAQV